MMLDLVALDQEVSMFRIISQYAICLVPGV